MFINISVCLLKTLRSSSLTKFHVTFFHFHITPCRLQKMQPPFFLEKRLTSSRKAFCVVYKTECIVPWSVAVIVVARVVQWQNISMIIYDLRLLVQATDSVFCLNMGTPKTVRLIEPCDRVRRECPVTEDSEELPGGRFLPLWPA